MDAAERNYRDPNHKPEMAVALTHFELICGFRPVAEIVANMRIAAPASSSAASSVSSAIRAASSCRCSSTASSRPTRGRAPRSSPPPRARIAEALDEGALPAEREGAFRWALSIMELFPGDVGAIMPLILNHVVLEPGQAAFIAPGELHAHLAGTCLEIMANSDNVIRGALTPKFVDLPELVSVLSFNPERLPPVLPPPSLPAKRPTRPSCPTSRSPGSPSGRGDATDARSRGPEILLCGFGQGPPSAVPGRARTCPRPRRVGLRGRRRLRLRDLPPGALEPSRSSSARRSPRYRDDLGRRRQPSGRAQAAPLPPRQSRGRRGRRGGKARPLPRRLRRRPHAPARLGPGRRREIVEEGADAADDRWSPPLWRATSRSRGTCPSPNASPTKAFASSTTAAKSSPPRTRASAAPFAIGRSSSAPSASPPIRPCAIELGPARAQGLRRRPG